MLEGQKEAIRNQESYPGVRVVFAEARLTSENVHCLELVGCP